MKGRKLHDLELLLYMSVRPSLFSIQNSDEYFIYISGYQNGKKAYDIYDFFNAFHEFLNKKYELEFKDKSLALTILFLSEYKGNSLMYLRTCLLDFLKEKKTKKNNLVKSYIKSNDLNDLLENYSQY